MFLSSAAAVIFVIATIIPTTHGFVINNNNNAVSLKNNGMHPREVIMNHHPYTHHEQRRGLLLFHDDRSHENENRNNNNNNNSHRMDRTNQTTRRDKIMTSSSSSVLPMMVSQLVGSLSMFSPEFLWSMVGTSLGYIKAEYGFSYAYGFGTALSAFSIFRRVSSTAVLSGPTPSVLMTYHACAIMFYGIRLNTFLFLRTRISDRQKQMIQRIEDRTTQRELTSKKNKFVARTPILLSCGILYYCLTLPVLLTGKLGAIMSSVAEGSSSSLLLPGASTLNLITAVIMKVLIGITWSGFLLAAFGDMTKSYVKYQQQNEEYLVTSGIFKYLRHPNYLGEMIGWSANTMCGLIAGTTVLVHLAKAGGIMYSAMTVSILAPMLGSILGWIGIMFVLLNATTNLEKNQQERYCTNNNNNNSEKYRSWIQSSWKGLTFSTRNKNKPVADGVDENEIEMSDIEEDSGSGI